MIANLIASTSDLLFPFADYWWFYGLFILLVLVVLLLDLGVFHRKAHAVSLKEAAIWSVVWVVLSLAFGWAFGWYATYRHGEVLGQQSMLEFFSGYIVEKSLSIDNIFVFVVIFSFLNIPEKYQHRILFWGIIGALLFRAIFISIGSVLMQYEFVLWIFGAFLILTGIKILFAPEKPSDPANNIAFKFVQKLFPVTAVMDGRFFAKEQGKRFATPLFLALVMIEFSDVIFAIDSVPAIFALTKEPVIVFTSNICAILGLRAMYFLLAGVVDKFRYLKYGLGIVLVFVGLKMVWLNHKFGGKFPIEWSLGIICGVVGLSIVASWIIPAKKHH